MVGRAQLLNSLIKHRSVLSIWLSLVAVVGVPVAVELVGVEEVQVVTAATCLVKVLVVVLLLKHR
jgi:hypothetical protein